jgi:uncharacterized protein with FMN-binding domain
MHRSIPAVLGAAAIVVPNAEAVAATTQTAKVTVTTRKYSGPTVQMEHGTVQVTADVRITTKTVGSKKVVTRKLYNLSANVQAGGGRSQVINEQAVPYLKTEALKAQTARIDAISGATQTSGAFIQSLQSALHAAHMA